MLKILHYPDKILHQPCRVVEKVDQSIVRLVSQMIEIVNAEEALGLAAVQIGVMKRVLVYPTIEYKEDPKNKDNSNYFEVKQLHAIINPEIISEKGTAAKAEACLSVPDFEISIKRATTIVVKGLTVEGKSIELTLHDMEARVMQHEVDHLNGVLIIDRASILKRSLYTKKRENSKI